MKLSPKMFLYPAANILVAILLLIIFFMAGVKIIQTFRVAGIAAIKNLQPQPMDYFLELNISLGTPDKNKLHCYVDYYEHLLRVFPNLWDAYGMLGYCYHYLNDDVKAIKFLKTAIQNSPGYFWNYYNLAAIYIDESRYQEASDLLHKALGLPPVSSLSKIFNSTMVYAPLLESNEKKAFVYTAAHLKSTYQTSYVILQLLSQAGNNNAQAVIAKLKPELYAF